MAPDLAPRVQPSPRRDSFYRDLDARRPTATWSDWSCTVRVVVADARVLAPAVTLVKNRMAQVERVSSRFVTDSDLNWANANGGRPVAVSGLLIELVEAALDGARRSDGALDPTVGRHLAAIGYDRDILLVTDRLADERVPAGPSGRTWRDVGVDRDLGLLTVPRGTALDLGATAKAQTADWAARAVHRRFGTAVMVEIGGDLAVAGGPPDGDWQVSVAERAGATGQQIGLRRGGMATSTTTVRTWRRGELRMHHIVDPRTSRPTGGPWRTVSVAAESALEANVCSTAAIVLGDRAPSWLASQGVAARLVDLGGRVTTLGGWPSERTIAVLEHASAQHVSSQHVSSQHASAEHAASQHIAADLNPARTSAGAR
jgi:FAD:protein FMN transferase